MNFLKTTVLTKKLQKLVGTDDFLAAVSDNDIVSITEGDVEKIIHRLEQLTAIVNELDSALTQQPSNHTQEGT